MRHVFWALSLFVLCLLSGCTERSTSGNTSVYTFATWALALPVLLGLFLIGVGFATRKKQPWGSYGLMALGVFVPALGVPLMLMDKVEVNDEHFINTIGLPWDQKKIEIRFDDLREIQIQVIETQSKSQGTRISYKLACSTKSSGTPEIVPVGNLMDPALGQILGIAKKKGIRLVGVEQLPERMQPRQQP